MDSPTHGPLYFTQGTKNFSYITRGPFCFTWLKVFFKSLWVGESRGTPSPSEYRGVVLKVYEYLIV